ncbi:hypothetical protein E9549_05380 [Blastococcus sp. MG754426]|uniref:hypothetical protein n=1 Tax=unclassified Blastococcus TaxID=2619396 RepID=UPI001EEFB4CD|nr:MULTISPECIES: hypothetical protein [unclassified Blastococcus]MCF6506839.1 hypothetical protein [Blastococcus sp. MG754426]MCF6511639.1 hypothetical protein [Blastococcus sp. MG754427]
MRFRQSSQVTVLNGWVDVLGAPEGSVEWAQRHAEVVGLYQGLLQQVSSLPEGDPNRDRALRYAPAWYRAVVWQNLWQSSQQRPSQVLSDAALDQLGSIAEILSYRLPGAAANPSDEAVARLRQELEDWLDLLAESADVPQSAREEIAGQIRHVLWLLDNIDTFGVAPVVREARTVVGRVTEASATQGWAKKWTSRIGTLVVALGLLTTGLQATTLALEAAQETVTVVSEIVRGESTGDEEPTDRPALPSGSGADPVDAEQTITLHD